jgi:predicted membrane protein
VASTPPLSRAEVEMPGKGFRIREESWVWRAVTSPTPADVVEEILLKTFAHSAHL